MSEKNNYYQKKKLLNKEKQNLKETIDNQLAKIGVPLSSTFNRDTASQPKTYDYYADKYNCSIYGSIIDRLISYILSGGFKISSSNPEVLQQLNDTVKNEKLNEKIRYFLKDYLAFGNAAFSINDGNDEVLVNNMDTQKVTPLYSDTKINEVQLYQIEYIYKDKTYLQYCPAYEYKYWDQLDNIDISKDSQSRLIRRDNILEDSCLIYKKCNDFHNSPRGLSFIARMGKNTEAFEQYLADTKAIAALYRSPFLDITVPLSGVNTDNGVDTNIQAAATKYKNWTPGTNIVHSKEEEWDIKEFNQKTIDADVRRGYMLLFSMVFGGGDILLGDASSSNYATAKALLQLFRDELTYYQSILSDILTDILKYTMKYLFPRYMDEEFSIIFAKPLLSLDDDPQYVAQWVNVYKEGIISYQTLCDKLGLDYEKEIMRKQEEKPITQSEGVENAQ